LKEEERKKKKEEEERRKKKDRTEQNRTAQLQQEQQTNRRIQKNKDGGQRRACVTLGVQGCVTQTNHSLLFSSGNDPFAPRRVREGLRGLLQRSLRWQMEQNNGNDPLQMTTVSLETNQRKQTKQDWIWK